MLLTMFSMVLLTFAVGCITLYIRFTSVKKRDVSIKYFQLMHDNNGKQIPDIVAKTGNHFSNLFETPVLFYVAASLTLIMGVETRLALVLAWLYVGFRIMHAYIHLTYNNVLHRMCVFWLSCFCILGLWINLLLKLDGLRLF
ncbi:MAPEG family protein [Flocculibacter collagenilyticus]|uniref:MAPEG family protein n=1 Tax=Flocculibacter collagenilyticus TaxID=2744479 RepID=UPI0018F4B18C|nr:MAPEG family protein [Flocculibacter collagenilyticus]